MPNTKIPSHLCWMLFIYFIGTTVLTEGRSGDKSIFLLAGQSNMAGRGGVIDDIWDGVVRAECQPRLSILRLDAKLRWVEANEPLHRDIDVSRTCGVGPGMAFANKLLGRAPTLVPLGLVPCAIGGTNISEWARGGLLYKKLVWRAWASLREGGSIQALGRLIR